MTDNVVVTAGGHVTDQISLGVLAASVPWDAVDDAVGGGDLWRRAGVAGEIRSCPTSPRLGARSFRSSSACRAERYGRPPVAAAGPLAALDMTYAPGSRAFTAAKGADDAVWWASYAHAEAVELNQADPGLAGPNRAVALQKEFRDRIEEAEKADSRLIKVVRDRMLGTRPLDNSLIGKLIYTARSRTSLR